MADKIQNQNATENIGLLQPRVTATPAYRQAVINAHLQACEELLSFSSELDRLQSESVEAAAQLKKAEQEAQKDFAKRVKAAEKNRHDAEKAFSSASDDLEKERANLQACRKRKDDLAAGRYSEADTTRIAKAEKLAHGPHDDTLKELAKEGDAAQKRLDDLLARIRQAKADIELTTTSLALFGKGDIPIHLKPALDQVASKAEADHATQESAARNTLDEFIGAQKIATRALAAANRRIEQAQANARKLKEAQSGSFWKRLGSSAWWGGIVTDYTKEAQSAGAQKAELNRKLASLADSIEGATAAHGAIVSSKEPFIAAAIAAERDRQHEECRQRNARLPGDVERLEGLAVSGRSALGDIEKRRTTIESVRKTAGIAAEDKERTTIVIESDAVLADVRVALAKAEADVAACKERVQATNTVLENLPLQQAAFMESQLADWRTRESTANASLQAMQEKVSKHTVELGINVSPPFSRTDIERIRDTLVAQLRETMGAAASEVATKPDGPSGGQVHRRTRMATDSIVGDQARVADQVLGNIYFDFERYAEDDSSRRGNAVEGLRTQLSAIRRKHRNALFPNLSEGEDILRLFIESLFPNGLTQSYAVCNLSFVPDQPLLCIRPRTIGPRLEQILPNGLTLAIRAELGDNRFDPNNPVLYVRRIEDLSYAEIRPFEREITAFVFCQANALYPRSMRQQNVVTVDFIQSLPLISVETQNRLKDWFAYLNWKERLIQANLVGLRYLEVDVGSDGRYRFLVVAESKESFERVRRTFRNDELRAFGLGYSQDPWDFQYNENHRGRDTELGDFAGYEELSAPPKVDTEGMPWDRPFFAFAFFRLSEDAQNEYDAMIEGGGSVDDARSHFRGLLKPSGFLALSVVGDLSLVRRQRREMELLQQQSGYAPLLSSYLFDIKAANEPTSLVKIADDQWFRNDLNEDQKLAVQKMISTPDLALVQGPPGTGKTTMIAEAIWQFVRQGKKVLVVSQANLAVDNALERLAHAPAVRAVRLGRKGEKDHPFSQTHVLKTYYDSIADTCRQRTLSAWSDGDSRSAVLGKWLADADLLANDIETLRNRETGVAAEITSLQTELAVRQTEAERIRDVERLRQDMTGFRVFLAQDAEWSGHLPDGVLHIYFGAVVTPIDKLTNVGIRLNRVWPQYEYGQLADKTRFALEILREWREVLRALPHIKGDLARLQSSDSETVLAPDDAIRLGELNRRLQAAQQAMVDDASKFDEWQSIQKEIRDVKRRGSGLDRNVYERVFNGACDGKPAYLVLIDPSAARVQVVALLEKAVSAIVGAQEDVARGINECEKAIEEHLKNLSAPQHDPASIQRIEGRLRELSHKASELSSQRRDKEFRLVAKMNDRLDRQQAGNALSVDDYPQVRSAVDQQLRNVQAQLNNTRAFREAWEPVLQKWVSDLTRPETVRCDQSTFLPAYISSCNVIGVTCTENRRTLEDATHTRFDVVIVDEVSKATPPEIIMPLLMGRTAILVGDHRQLPPLFKEREGSWEEVVAAQEENAQSGEAPDAASELTAENFERFRRMVTSSLFKEHFESAPDSLKSFLFTQYRMHPQIMRVVNQFYENRLVCGLTDPDAKQEGSDPRGHRVHGMTLVGVRNQKYLKPEQHVLWLDSTIDPQGQKHFESRDGASSKVNDLEAILIAKCLLDIEEACRAQGYGSGHKKPKQVGVITFYGRQVRTIREAVRQLQRLRKCEFSAIRYDINTVDRYQGQERPIIIVSMVRNPPWKLSSRANTAQFERINVAFSRAQELLIVTGAKDVFCSYPVDLPYLDRPGRRKVEVYRYIIDEILRGGGFWKSDTIIDAQEFSRLMPKDQATHHQSNRRQGRR